MVLLRSYLFSNRLHHKRHRPVPRDRVFHELPGAPDAREHRVVLHVQHHHGDFAVGVQEGGGDEVVLGRCAGDPLRAGADEPRKLPERVMRGVIAEFAGVGVAVDDGAAADAGGDAGVARAVLLVEDQVPHAPAFGPVVEVHDDAAREFLGRFPIAADAALAV